VLVLTIPRLLRPLFRRRREDVRPGVVVSIATAGDLVQWLTHVRVPAVDAEQGKSKSPSVKAVGGTSLSLALIGLVACGGGSPSSPPTPTPPVATPVPGTSSTTGPETVSIGELYTSNWRSSDFAGTALRRWTPAGDAFYFKWSTTAGDQIGRIGRTWPSAALGVRVDEVRGPCLMSTTAEAKDVSSSGYHMWSIYGWTHADNAGWQSPNGWNNEFYVTFHSWSGSLRAPFTAARGHVPIESVSLDRLGGPEEGLRVLAFEGPARRVRRGPRVGRRGGRQRRRLDR